MSDHEARTVMQSAINHRPKGKTRVLTGEINGQPAVFSYGYHFPLAIKATELDYPDAWWVNRDRYEGERDWGNYYAYGQPRRSPSYSRVTETHRDGVEQALRAAGYNPTPHTMTSGYQYRLWAR